MKRLAETKEETLRKSGNRAALDALRAELSTFEKEGKLPTMAPISLAKKQASMRGDLEQAYKTAVRDYTRKGADGEAQKAEAEWKEFRNAPIIAATKRKLLGTWSLRVDNGYTSDLVFHEDGTVDHTMSGGTMPWKIDLDAGFVFLGNDKKGDKIQLPLNEDKGTGTNGGGQQFTVTKKK